MIKIIIIESLREAVNIFLTYWWFFSPFILWPLFLSWWVKYVQEKYIKGIQWCLLEVKVPADLEIRPKTMEKFFTSISSTYDVVIDTLYDVYLVGMVDVWFSFEIVSFGGDIHFYVRTPLSSKGIIEAQIYAEYPGAEIKEVDDYVYNIPADAPNAEYDLWGTDMTLAKESAYPIKTYVEFEDKDSGEFVDPVANIIEGVTKIGEGEQIWIQILIKATSDQWKAEARDIVAELAGKKKKSKKSNFFLLEVLREIVDLGRHIVFDFFNPNMSTPSSGDDGSKEGGELSMMLHLTSGERAILDAIDRKIQKAGFETDIRYIYVAQRKKFDKGKANSIFFTYLSQFNTEYLNRLVPDGATKTSAYYFLADMRKAIRKRLIIDKYRERILDKKSYVMTADELATLFHFPTKLVQAPKVQAKKGKPPISLPI